MSEGEVRGELVLHQVEDGIAVLTINRPEVLNALSPAVMDELGQHVDRAVTDGVGAIVITGAGEKAFVAGADIKSMRDYDMNQAVLFAKRGQRVLDKLADFPGIVIAAVNGFALGGGCEICMACDLTIAAENARFGQPEVNLGIIPGFGGTQRMVRRVGLQRALELCTTARMIGAEEAVRIGLALEVVPRGEALAKAKEIARTIASKGPVAIRLTKESVHRAAELDLNRGLDQEAVRFGLCFDTEDHLEGFDAFIEKRSADFKGK